MFNILVAKDALKLQKYGGNILLGAFFFDYTPKCIKFTQQNEAFYETNIYFFALLAVAVACEKEEGEVARNYYTIDFEVAVKKRKIKKIVTQ